MVRGVYEEQVEVDNGPLLKRRRAVSLAAVLALGMSAGAAISDRAGAAKQHKKRKEGKKGKTKEATGGSGSEVVHVAKKYKGSRYVSGGASPKGFDCSGFTWYVYQKAAGMDITRGVVEQWQLGRSVGRGEWQAGDLVCCENAFKR